MQGHDQSSTLSQHTAELTLPKHSPLHRDLLRYAKLMEWLKNTHREKYEGLSRVSNFIVIYLLARKQTGIVKTCFFNTDDQRFVVF